MTSNTQSIPRTEPEIFSIEDIEPYTQCVYRGQRGRIMDIGEDVLGNVAGRHIEIRITEEDAETRTYRVHENLVHMRLNDGKELWVDFDNALSPYTED